MSYIQIEFLAQKKSEKNSELIQKVFEACLEEEKILKKELYFNIVLTNSEYIKNLNKEYRNIDKETDVLSFPMFEKKEIKKIIKKQRKIETNKIKIGQINKKIENIPYIIGDIVISLEKVIKQAEQYNHSFDRELAYMVVHGFYHLMGYDHEKKQEKEKMRKKEEKILKSLEILK